MKTWTNRVLSFDFKNEEVINVEKGRVNRAYKLDELLDAGLNITIEGKADPLYVNIRLTKNREYKCVTQSKLDAAKLVKLIKAIRSYINTDRPLSKFQENIGDYFNVEQHAHDRLVLHTGYVQVRSTSSLGLPSLPGIGRAARSKAFGIPRRRAPSPSLSQKECTVLHAFAEARADKCIRHGRRHRQLEPRRQARSARPTLCRALPGCAVVAPVVVPIVPECIRKGVLSAASLTRVSVASACLLLIMMLLMVLMLMVLMLMVSMLMVSMLGVAADDDYADGVDADVDVVDVVGGWRQEAGLVG
jgi:hypothetical protein